MKYLYSLLLFVFIACHCDTTPTPTYGGCAGVSYATSSDSFQKLKSSGNISLDQAISLEYVGIERFYAFSIPAYYFNDSNSPNAYASQTSREIYLGVNLVAMQCTSGAAGCNSIPFILAHEYGHQNAYRNNYSFSIVKWGELYADFMAGAYLYARTYNNSSFNAYSIALSFANLGDYNFYDPNSHGTPQERYNAVNNGYTYAQQASNFGASWLSTTQISAYGYSLYGR